MTRTCQPLSDVGNPLAVITELTPVLLLSGIGRLGVALKEKLPFWFALSASVPPAQTSEEDAVALSAGALEKLTVVLADRMVQPLEVMFTV